MINTSIKELGVKKKQFSGFQVNCMDPSMFVLLGSLSSIPQKECFDRSLGLWALPSYINYLSLSLTANTNGLPLLSRNLIKHLITIKELYQDQ